MVVVLARLTIVIAMMSLIIVRMPTVTKTCTILISVLVRTRWYGGGDTKSSAPHHMSPPPSPLFPLWFFFFLGRRRPFRTLGERGGRGIEIIHN